MKVRLGKVMLTPAGAYNSATTYSRLDIVSYEDCAYVSLIDDNTGNNITDENCWMLLFDGSFTREYFEQNGITVASLTCTGDATVNGNITISGSIVSSDLQTRLNTLNSAISSNTSKISALTSRVTANEASIQDLYANGGGSGSGSSVDPAVISELRTLISQKLDITYFNQMFKAYNGTTPILPNNGDLSAMDSIKALANFWTEGGISAYGTNSDSSEGGSSGGSSYLSELLDVSLATLEDGQALVYDSSTSKWVNGSVVPDLTGYATETYVTSQLGSYYTSQQTDTAIQNAISELDTLNPSDYYKKTETYSQTECNSLFVLKAGDTMSGSLTLASTLNVQGNATFTGSKIHLGQNTAFENYNLGSFYLPTSSGTYTLATQDQVEERLLSTFFDKLFVALDSNGNELDPNDTTTTIASIKARYDFWSEGSIAALGSTDTDSGVALGELLTSLNNSGLSTPTESESGMTIIWSGSAWTYGTAGGSNFDANAMWAELQGTTGSTKDYKINAAHIPDLSSTYLTNTTAESTYLKIDDAESKYLTQTNAELTYVPLSVTWWGQSVSNGKVNGSISEVDFIEFTGVGSSAGYGGYIDFHYNGSSDDYTSRIIEPSSGTLALNECLYALKDGFVGINCVPDTTNSYKLDVSGDIRTTGSITIGGGKIAWDSTNNALYVQTADGGICHFYSLGGISALGVGTDGSASIDTLTMNTVRTANLVAAENTITMTPGDNGLSINLRMIDGYQNIAYIHHHDGDLSIGCNNYIYMNQDIIIDGYRIIGNDEESNTIWSINGSGKAAFAGITIGQGDEINDISWDGTYLKIMIGSNTYNFQPV